MRVASVSIIVEVIVTATTAYPAMSSEFSNDQSLLHEDGRSIFGLDVSRPRRGGTYLISYLTF